MVDLGVPLGAAPFPFVGDDISLISHAVPTIGDKPSLRFVLNVSRAKTLIAQADSETAPTLAPPAGMSS